MKEALKLALDLAIMHHSDDGYAELRLKVRQLAKEALEQPDYRAVKTYHEGKPVYVSQPEQEPVAEVKAKQDGYGGTFIQQYQLLEHGTKLYTTPPKEQQSCDKRPWVGLTDEGIQTIHDMYYRRMGPQEFARAIEAKLKELNT